MKKLFNFALVGAIALTGATMFTSCSSSDDAAAENNNPNYNSEKNEVTTQFVLNVAANTGDNTTRQSAVTVQQSANFRGMQNAMLIALKTGATGIADFGAPYAGTDLGTGNHASYDMGMLYGPTAVSNTGNNNSDNSSRRILRMTLPVGYDAMLVYARAIQSGTNAQNGTVSYNVNTTTPSSSSFSLVPRIGANEPKYNEICGMIAHVLNYIIDASVDADTDGYEIKDGSDNIIYSTTETLPALSWKGMTAAGNPTQLETILRQTYEKLTVIKTGEFRDGSTASIIFQIFGLNTVLNGTSGVLTAIPTSDAELNAYRLAKEIDKRVKEFFNIASSIDDSKFKDIATINTAATNKGWITSDYTFTEDQLTTFPASFALPQGIALLYFPVSDTDKHFTYHNPSTSLLADNTNLAPSKYMYPTELLYFDNSTLRVNNSEVLDSDYPNGYSNWNTGFGTGWSVESILPSTRSIAVTNNINYGVSMLKTTVTFDGTSFKDNRAELTTETTDQSFSGDALGLTLTGVLIGDQNSVGWNFLPVSTDGNVIYDTSINSPTMSASASASNYTLVFDNYKLSGTQSSDVYVALEFKNGSNEFYGKDNLIQGNGHFYLVGKLSLASGGDPDWDPNYPVPPYKTDGSSIETKRVFIQDHVTDATFKIGLNSLQKAYLTVPDLRDVQTSLGLSVDLKWQKGLTFDGINL